MTWLHVGSSPFIMGQSELHMGPEQSKGWMASDAVGGFSMTPEVTFSLMPSSHVFPCFFFYPQHLCLSTGHQQCFQPMHRLGQECQWVNILRSNPQSLKHEGWWSRAQFPQPWWEDPEMCSTQLLRRSSIWSCPNCSEHWPVWLPPSLPLHVSWDYLPKKLLASKSVSSGLFFWRT